MISKEDVEQQALVNYLKLHHYDFFAPMNENMLSFLSPKMAVIVEAKAKALGKQKGVLDLVIFLDNKILFLEMKRQGKVLKSGKISHSNSKVSDEQNDFREMLLKYTYTRSAIAYGYKEAIKIIEELR